VFAIAVCRIGWLDLWTIGRGSINGMERQQTNRHDTGSARVTWSGHVESQ